MTSYISDQSPVPILVVEDDNATAQIIAIGLRNLHQPYELDQAFSAEEALVQWNERAYKLLLVDYNLRGMTGLALITHLRQTGALTPIILFTAYDSSDLRHMAEQLGVAAYVVKPFFIDEFVELVRAVLSKHKEQ